MGDQEMSMALLLDRCLDELTRGRSIDECLESAGERRDEIEPMLRAAARLRALGGVGLGDERLAAGEARLMAAIEAAGEGAVTKPWLSRPFSQKRPAVDWSRQPRRYGMTALVSALALTLAIACGGTVGASQTALPGQPLYRVKQLTESAQLATASSDLVRMRLQLRFADERLEELETLAESGAEAVVAELADAYVASAEAATRYCAGQVEAADCEHLLLRLQEHEGTLLRVRQRLSSRVSAGSEALQALASAAANCEVLQERTGRQLQMHGGWVPDAGPTGSDDPEDVPAATVPPDSAGNEDAIRDRDRDRVCTSTPAATGTWAQPRNRAGQGAEGDSVASTPEPAADVATEDAAVATATPEASQEQQQHREREQNGVATATEAPAGGATEVPAGGATEVPAGGATEVPAGAGPAQNREQEQNREQADMAEQEQAGNQEQNQEQNREQNREQAAAPTEVPAASTAAPEVDPGGQQQGAAEDGGSGEQAGDGGSGGGGR